MLMVTRCSLAMCMAVLWPITLLHATTSFADVFALLTLQLILRLCAKQVLCIVNTTKYSVFSKTTVYYTYMQNYCSLLILQFLQYFTIKHYLSVFCAKMSRSCAITH